MTSAPVKDLESPGRGSDSGKGFFTTWRAPNPAFIFRQPIATNPSQPVIAPGSSLPTDVAALQSMVNSLQAELKATNSVNTHLAATVARLQAEQAPSTPTTTTTSTPTPTPSTATQTTPTPSTHPPGTGQTTPTPPTPTTTSTDTPIPCSHPDHPRTIASGRGAASPEVFQHIIRTNWHGRLGRTHMVDVDNLPPSALAELDCLLRRKLHVAFPRGGAFTGPDPDIIFSSLAALGLRLEDRGAYADLLVINDSTLQNESMLRRGKNFAACYYAHGNYADYWRGTVLETMVELARYRGLFDDEGFLKAE